MRVLERMNGKADEWVKDMVLTGGHHEADS